MDAQMVAFLQSLPRFAYWPTNNYSFACQGHISIAPEVSRSPFAPFSGPFDFWSASAPYSIKCFAFPWHRWETSFNFSSIHQPSPWLSVQLCTSLCPDPKALSAALPPFSPKSPYPFPVALFCHQINFWAKNSFPWTAVGLLCILFASWHPFF